MSNSVNTSIKVEQIESPAIKPDKFGDRFLMVMYDLGDGEQVDLKMDDVKIAIDRLGVFRMSNEEFEMYRRDVFVRVDELRSKKTN